MFLDLSGVEESEGPPHFTLKVYNNCYSLFSSSQGVENDPEVLFSKQPELFDEPLNIFLAQIQAHFGIQNDVTLFLPSLDLHFPINMTFTQVSKFFLSHYFLTSPFIIFSLSLSLSKLISLFDFFPRQISNSHLEICMLFIVKCAAKRKSLKEN